MAGVPFDVIERLATRESLALARELAARKQDLAGTISEVERFFASREQLLSPEAYRLLRLAVRSGQPPAEVAGEQPAVFRNYAAAATAVASLEAKLELLLQRETLAARSSLHQAAAEILPYYFVFGSTKLENLLLSATIGESPPPRKSEDRKRERHLLLYLQRIAAKNDTLSEFGPIGWGAADNNTIGINLAPQNGVATREVFLERWTAHAVTAAINADPETFAELSPRLNPNGRIDGTNFVLTDADERTSVTPEELKLIERCDGETAVHKLAASSESIRALVEKKILRCVMEVSALDPYAFSTLREDVEKWRANPVREKWLSILRPVDDLPRKFARAIDAKERKIILEEARSRLHSLGIARKSSARFLYSATNPIGEECLRDCNFSISQELINKVALEAAPWIDLWRDSYAFVASRVADGLRGVLEKAPLKNGAIPLPAFLRTCETARLPLTGPGLVGLAALAFQEVKAAFGERLQSHIGSDAYELTSDDCHVVRKNFRYPKFDEYTWPAADLQMASKSIEAVSRGDYQWVLAELHPPVALMHHCFYWSCPETALLNEALSQTVAGKPNFHFGFFAADFTSHTTVRLFDALPDFSNFVAPQPCNPNWRKVRPADAEVYIDEDTSDVCLRRTGSHEYLGSFARAWLIPLGFHPFQFSVAPHTPRLLCGRVIVQRRTWIVTREELPAGDYTGISRDLVVAIEQMREQKNLPRYVYIRPTEQALRRSGAEGRDKDTKPVFIDLESYLFLEIFHRWLTKAGELEITEMLPDPDDLLWREPDGRRTFELRTLIVPRE